MRLLHVGHGFRPFHRGGLINYAEDLMQAQAARGHEVAYFFAGRRYPWIRPRVHRWKRAGVSMHELLNSPVPVGLDGDRGTRWPELDLSESHCEALFREVLGRVRPDAVHVHELAGLPSSLLELPGERGTPVVMSLRDYFPLCPTWKLFDADGRLCQREDPAPQCMRCCRDAPHDAGTALRTTLRYQRLQAATRLPALDRIPRFEALAGLMRGGGPPEPGGPSERRAGSIEGFRARRRVNLRRLSRVDRLLALSPRTAEIYGCLGVDTDRMEVMPIGPRHLEGITPRRIESPRPPIRFVTLNGCVSKAKGAGVVAEAIERLAAEGLSERELTVTVVGAVDSSVRGTLDRSSLASLHEGYESGGLDSLLDGFHVGVVPSIWEEALGFVGVEMLAKGLPVIANALGGMVEYARDGETGWLNRDNSGPGLARIMTGIVAAPGQVAELNRTILERRSELVRPAGDWLDELDRVYSEVRSQSVRSATPRG